MTPDFAAAISALDAARDRYNTALSDLLAAEHVYKLAREEWERTGPFAKLFHPEPVS